MKGFHKEYRDAQINRLNKWHCFKTYTAIIDVAVADSYRAVVVIARQSSKTYDISAGACGHDQETKGMFEKFFHRKWITLKSISILDNEEQHTVRSIISDICDDERYTAICKGNSDKTAIEQEILNQPFSRKMV